jgi:PTS system nitrogen regulatory IIA component
MQLNSGQAAKLLNVSAERFQRWVDEGRIPCSMVNDRPRFNQSELLEWASAQGIAAKPHALDGAAAGPGRGPLLSEALRLGGIAHGVQAKDKQGALKAALKALKLPKGADRELLLGILSAREALGSTAVGEGVAIPHVRTPVILDVKRPWAGLCFLEQGVDFGAADGKPVHTLFVLIVPTLRTHLGLLASLGLLLQDPGFAAALKERPSAERILQRCREAEQAME